MSFLIKLELKLNIYLSIISLVLIRYTAACICALLYGRQINGSRPCEKRGLIQRKFLKRFSRRSGSSHRLSDAVRKASSTCLSLDLTNRQQWHGFPHHRYNALHCHTDRQNIPAFYSRHANSRSPDCAKWYK